MAAMASLASAGISHSQIRPPALANPNHSHSSPVHPVRPVVVVFSGSLALWLSASLAVSQCAPAHASALSVPQTIYTASPCVS